MNLRLEGKRALVTGSSSGIGETIARSLAREGALVVVHGRNEQRGRLVAEDIARQGGRAFCAIGDLAKEAGAAAVAEQTLAALKGLDILVNNAGGADGGPQGWISATAADWTAS